MSKFQAIAVIALFCLSASPTPGQQGEKEPTPLIFSEVIEVHQAQQDELYARAKIWFVSAFVDSKRVLEADDKADGLLVGKGSMPYEPTMLRQAPLRGEILFMLKVAVKDGRYKYELSDFRHHASGSFIPGLGKFDPVDLGLITTSDQPPETKTLYKKVKHKALDDMKAMANATAAQLITSLKAGMLKNSKGSEQW